MIGKLSSQRRRLFWLFVIISSLIFVEWAAKLSVVMMFGVRESSYHSYYADDPKLRLVTWTDPYEPHPYFGYVEPHGYRERTNLLDTRGDNDYIIGILGGSVAEMFGNFLSKNPQYLQKLKTLVPQIADKNIRLVNFAHGGYKQPQQFFIASYFSDRIDLLLNLDGFNEISAEGFAPLYPLDYPILSLRFYGKGAVGWRSLGNVLKSCYRAINFVPRAVPGMSRSSMYFLFWQVSHRLLYDAIRAVERLYFVAMLRREPGPAAGDFSIDEKVAIWKRYTILQSRVAASSHKTAIFFVQPNQYVSGSKPLSGEERAQAYNPVVSDTFARGMRLLRDAVPELRQSGVPMFDATLTFGGVEETLYTDACCHLNSRGNELLADAIFPILAEQLEGAIR